MLQEFYITACSLLLRIPNDHIRCIPRNHFRLVQHVTLLRRVPPRIQNDRLFRVVHVDFFHCIDIWAEADAEDVDAKVRSAGGGTDHSLALRLQQIRRRRFPVRPSKLQTPKTLGESTR